MIAVEVPPTGSPSRSVAGRYQLGPVIGVGSSAVVRRGRDLRKGETVAVKLFHAAAASLPPRQHRREVEALSRLDHPGLVGLHEGGVDHGRPFLVTDLVEGPSLAERIRSGPVPPFEVRRLGAALADALAYVHDVGIVHRDVKPANVLLGDDDGARLTDFGIAKTLDSATATATATGNAPGTAAYLAPEQVRGEEVGAPADIYALGLVLLEALTARREYQGGAMESAVARLHRRPVVPDDLPAGMTVLLRAMTGDDPACRPRAAEVAAHLRTPASAGTPRDRSRDAAHAAGTGPRHALAPEPVMATTARPRHALVEEPDAARSGEPRHALAEAHDDPSEGTLEQIPPLSLPWDHTTGPVDRGRARHRRHVPSRTAAPLAAALLVLSGVLGGYAACAGDAPRLPGVGHGGVSARR